MKKALIIISLLAIGCGGAKEPTALVKDTPEFEVKAGHYYIWGILPHLEPEVQYVDTVYADSVKVHPLMDGKVNPKYFFICSKDKFYHHLLKESIQ